MPLNIQPVGMWVTPKSQAELQEMVEGLNSPEAIHAMMFTWNYLAGVVAEYQAKDRSSQNPYANIGDPDGDD